MIAAACSWRCRSFFPRLIAPAKSSSSGSYVALESEACSSSRSIRQFVRRRTSGIRSGPRLAVRTGPSASILTGAPPWSWSWSLGVVVSRPHVWGVGLAVDSNPAWPVMNDAESDEGGSNSHSVNPVLSRLGVVSFTPPPSPSDGMSGGMLKLKVEVSSAKAEAAVSSRKKSASLRVSREVLKL